MNKLKLFFSKLFNHNDEQFAEDQVFNEAHQLNSYLLNNYSIEEQSKIIKLMADYLVNHRIQQIEEVEVYLHRLKEDLTKLRE